MPSIWLKLNWFDLLWILSLCSAIGVMYHVARCRLHQLRVASLSAWMCTVKISVYSRMFCGEFSSAISDSRFTIPSIYGWPTNLIYGTGSVKIRTTRHKIPVDMRIFLQCAAVGWCCRSAGGGLRVLVASHGRHGLAGSSHERPRGVLPERHRSVDHGRHCARSCSDSLHQGHVNLSH